jgi:hypothetical protein
MIAIIGTNGGSQYKGPCLRDLQLQVPNNHHVGHEICENLQPLENFEQGLE